MGNASASTVFLSGLVTALATGLGALPLLFFHSASRTVLGGANAAAAGVMLAATAGLAWEGASRSVVLVAVGFLAGMAFIALVRRVLEHDTHVAIGALRGDAAVKALLIVAVMTVHSAAEGIAIGASFGEGVTLGLVITLAIAVHNIPEGLAISLVLVPRGVSVPVAAWWSVFSSLPQPLLAVPAFLFVETFDGLEPAALGFAAGAMAWMAGRELLPQALSQARARVVAVVALASFAGMGAFQAVLL